MRAADHAYRARWLAVACPAVAASALTFAAEAAEIRPSIDLYLEHCAACHGADLEGQPNWKSRLPSGRMPAPPHDASGHTWHHPDRILFEIIKQGAAAIIGGGYESDMPGFGGTLTDAEIRAIIEYIKSTWPARERQYQAERSRADEQARQ